MSDVWSPITYLILIQIIPSIIFGRFWYINYRLLKKRISFYTGFIQNELHEIEKNVVI